MPHLPTRSVLNLETILPDASPRAFQLKGLVWPFPEYDTVEALVDRLVRAEVLVHDPVITTAVQEQHPPLASRTIRHRFLRATGLTQSHVRQLQRAQQARSMLAHGVSIPDTMFELGYYDQPHLTRSLKHFVGYTPTQLIRMPAPT